MNKIISIPFSPPDITEEEINEVVDTMRSGWITTGPKTKQLEKDLAAFCNTSRLVCLSSATAAMELTLRVMGIGPGDEVITSAYTYTASASVILHVGATPVLVDTARDSYQMDYEKLEQAITMKTKAIIPVDIGGVMCDYDRIFAAVNRAKAKFRPSNRRQEVLGRVIVIADAAHSLGAVWKGKPSGSVADFTCFSFHAVKNLTTAEGGAVTWRDLPGVENEALYHQYMLLSLHGQTKDAFTKTKKFAWEYDIAYAGYKCNMTDIMASIGLVQLRRYPGLLRRRCQLIELYNRELENEDLQILQHSGSDYASNGHLYLVRLLGQDADYRDAVIRKMGEKGIATNVHFKPLPMHTAYIRIGFNIKDYPNAYRQYQNEITLPLYSRLSDEEAMYVCTSLKNSIAELSEQEKIVSVG